MMQNGVFLDSIESLFYYIPVSSGLFFRINLTPHLLESTGLGRYLELRRDLIDRELARLVRGRKPATIYDPLKYVLSPGGKRLRAILVLMACDAVGGNAGRALPAALAVECLHNFTLIHDDVMDEAPVRHGRRTVHTRWNGAVAILAGDQLLALGYRALTGGTRTPPGAALGVFTAAFTDVCEGQGFDLEHEARRAVTMREYMRMIELKTARVIAAAAELGGLFGGGSPRQVRALRRYGERLGMAFQIMDDLLDVVGSPRTFGKKIGGDIARGKKTYLLVRALQKSRGRDRALLLGTGASRARVGAVKRVYEKTGAIDSARREVVRLTRIARESLSPLPSNGGRTLLMEFADRLAGRIA